MSYFEFLTLEKSSGTYKLVFVTPLAKYEKILDHGSFPDTMSRQDFLNYIANINTKFRSMTYIHESDRVFMTTDYKTKKLTWELLPEQKVIEIEEMSSLGHEIEGIKTDLRKRTDRVMSALQKMNNMIDDIIRIKRNK